MKMSAADQTAYPRFAKYVREQGPIVVQVPAIVHAMMKMGQLTNPKLKSALTWGRGATIKVTPLTGGAYGEFIFGTKWTKIRIEKKVVEEFEQARR
jgi:hypothetical protein